ARNMNAKTPSASARLVVARPADEKVLTAFSWHCAADVVESTGVVVRCTPARRVWFLPFGHSLGRTLDPGGEGRHGVFVKRWDGRNALRGALGEWEGLAQLDRLGLRCASRVCLASSKGSAVVVTQGLSGRPLDVIWAEGCEGRGLSGLEAVTARVGAAVRRLHDSGFVYRDLYWQHLFASDQPERRSADLGEPAFLDAERLLRLPWWWSRERACARDLSGLISSLPRSVGDDEPSRKRVLSWLERGYGPIPRRDWIFRKAEAIAGRQPRFG
ncbi:MAG: lipopolysaccharide kinase InaA family protein, partial [Myxococcota bacterium]